MKLIVGIGNPGDKYNFTRHNFGFLILDFYLKLKKNTWQKSPKHQAIYTKQDNNIFIKPQSFYNQSGIVVKQYVDYYKIAYQDILVICDDFDLNYNTIRFRTKGSSGGNNGLKSIIKELKSSDFPRLRLGTNNPELRSVMGDTNFVLSRFSDQEKVKLPDILMAAVNQIDHFILAD